MKYMMGKLANKDDEYLTFLDELFSDISGWITLHMTFEDSLEDFAGDIKAILQSKQLWPSIYREGMVEKFRDCINEGDCLLAIGDDEFTLSMVKATKSDRIKVYGICFDEASPLVSYCDEVLIIVGDYENHTDLFSKTLRWKYLGRVSRPIIDSRTPGSYLSSGFGFVIDVRVRLGDKVKKGDVLCVIEAMKMEEELLSDVDGVVEGIFIKPGDRVEFDEVLMIIK